MSRSATRPFLTSFASLVFAFLALTGAAQAAVEINTADASQLESVKGIGPSLSVKILAERKQGNFKDWSDLETRVAGVGEKNAAAFSRNGLTVGGKPKDGVVAGVDAAKPTKTASKKEATGTADPSLAASARK